MTNTTSSRKNHRLEICVPRSTTDFAAELESDQPFGSIAVGDFLNPRTFSSDADLTTKLLRVVRVEHFLWMVDDQPRHTVRLYTEADEDVRENRVTPQKYSGF